MLHQKFIRLLNFILISILIVSSLSSCSDSDLYYFKQIRYGYDIITLAENMGTGKINKWGWSTYPNNVSLQGVITKDGQRIIKLLADLTTSQPIVLKNTDLDLNGYSITNSSTTIIKTYGECRIYNGSLISNLTDSTDSDSICTARLSKCYLDNVLLETKNTNANTFGISSFGFLSLNECEVVVSSEGERAITIAIYGNLFSNIEINNSRIFSESDQGRVEGVFVGDKGTLTNSEIKAYSNYSSNEKDFVDYSIGCNNEGTLVINNCDIYGVHSAVNSIGDLTVDGGTYSGYGHGGIYCSGIGKTSKISNATIKEASLPSGYEDLNPGCMQAGMYIGGGPGRNNNKVYVEGCTIIASKSPIVLRGTSDETNNSLYIANTKLDIQHIRVDNDTHKIFLGEGCNFDQNHIDLPEVVFEWEEESNGELNAPAKSDLPLNSETNRDTN